MGFPLAQRLLSKENKIKGSTTTAKKLTILRQSGIDPYLVDLPSGFDDPGIEPFWETDILILNIPPNRKNPGAGETYLEIVKRVLGKASNHSFSWIIFTSSTSVYSEVGGLTSENDAKRGTASRKSGEILLEAEEMIQKSDIDHTILRLGGLYGYGRHPVNYLSGKRDLEKGGKPVNLVHQLDCVNVIEEIINQKKRNEIYNVVSDGHPPRKEFYRSAASHFNLPQPTFKPDSNSGYRIISNQKLKEDLFYKFSYPNPMDHTP